MKLFYRVPAPPDVPDVPPILAPPAFAGPERRGQRAAIRVVAIVSLFATAAYLTWRVAFTMTGADLWLAIPLWLLEVHAALGLGLYVFSLWDVDSTPPARVVERTDLRIAVLIPTYNEDRDVVLPTIASAVALEPAHETWVLDDGNRPWLHDLAAELGARYLARTEHSHAKAGNINNALEYVDADVVGVLDADHVPTPDFLTHTLGYFDDPRMAVVQTPQDFYNADSFENGPNRSWFWPRRRNLAYNEQRLFYRAIQPGKNRWGAAFWCGTSALVRVAALKEVGGVACETLTEDIHTTVRLHRRGWHSVFHNEVLAYGLAASDAGQYQSQRVRWGTGAMQLLRLEHPLTGRGLALKQRLAYAATLLGWFDAWRSLGFVLLPLAVMLSGAMPVVAPAGVFLLWFGVAFLTQRVALGALGRGLAPQGMAILFEFIRMPANLTATLSLFGRRERRFKVTGKGGSSARQRTRVPALLVALSCLTVLALVWFALTLRGLTPTDYRVPWAAYGAAGWSVVNGVFLVAAMRRVGSEHFAADRRRGVRLQMRESVLVDDRPADLLDLSVGGALLRCVPAPPGSTHRIRLSNDGVEVSLAAVERHRVPDAAGGALVALEFAPGQDAVAAEQFVGALFRGQGDRLRARVHSVQAA